MDRRQLMTLGLSFAALSSVPALAAAQEAARAAVSANPLLAEWTGPYGGVPPWDQVTPELLRDAMLQGIELNRAEIAAIVANPEAPTFDNTILAMEKAGSVGDRAGALFGVQISNLATPEIQALYAELAPLLAAAGDEVTFNAPLFARVRTVHETAAAQGLTAEQARLAQRYYEGFVRSGAALDAEGKAELGRINQELAGTFAEFSRKVLADESTWTVVTDEARLAGLSDSAKAAARAAAASRNIDGFILVNTRSVVDPVLTFGDDRALREEVWRKFVNRGDNGDANDTNATIANIVRLRAQRAQLLGYESHAHWRMQDTMARTPEAAMDLMMRVWPAAVARVAEEVRDMESTARDLGHSIDRIEPWDYLYYAEKVRKARYDLDQAELRPYFELNAMKRGAFHMAERLYGITFTPLAPGTVPVFHPDVEVFEVKEAATGNHVGLFYSDDFARQGKRSGAWATAYRIHHTLDGQPTNVLASNNNNFVKPGPGEPLLISLDDTTTLFHEFGHALHSLLSKVNYPSLAFTPRDFVEYPSQVHERWVLTRPILDQFARHYETGEPMPQSLLDRIEASSTFNEGYATVSYLSSALVDMDLHLRDLQALEGFDTDAFERESLQRIGMPREIVMRHRLPQFNHLFSSDAYSAGYYSYLWSEVMDADTWAAFEEAGDPFDPELARRFKEIILAQGNTIDRAEAYRAFRGRDPDVAALLRARGFPTT